MNYKYKKHFIIEPLITFNSRREGVKGLGLDHIKNDTFSLCVTFHYANHVV